MQIVLNVHRLWARRCLTANRFRMAQTQRPLSKRRQVSLNENGFLSSAQKKHEITAESSNQTKLQSFFVETIEFRIVYVNINWITNVNRILGLTN